MSQLDPAIHLVNDRALLLSFTHHPDIPAVQRLLLRLGRELQQSLRTPDNPQAPLRNIIPGPGNLTLELAADTDMSLTTLTEHLEQCWKSLTPDETVSAREHRIPVVYGGRHGPDLDTVAAHAGLSPEEVIQRHAGGQYDVLCLGFQPGFAYLHGLDPSLHTPRRDNPRTRIPAGSVAIGGSRTGVYPSASPGGWQVIGHTALTLFDPGNPADPTLLLPGDRIQFIIEDAHV